MPAAACTVDASDEGDAELHPIIRRCAPPDGDASAIMLPNKTSTQYLRSPPGCRYAVETHAEAALAFQDSAVIIAGALAWAHVLSAFSSVLFDCARPDAQWEGWEQPDDRLTMMMSGAGGTAASSGGTGCFICLRDAPPRMQASKACAALAYASLTLRRRGSCWRQGQWSWWACLHAPSPLLEAWDAGTRGGRRSFHHQPRASFAGNDHGGRERHSGRLGYTCGGVGAPSRSCSIACSH